MKKLIDGKNMNEKLNLAMKTLRSIQNNPAQADAILLDIMDTLEAMEEPKYADDKIILPHSFSARLCFNMGWMAGSFNVLDGLEQTCDAAWQESISCHLHNNDSTIDVLTEAVSALTPFAVLAKKYKTHIANTPVTGSTTYDRAAHAEMIKEEAMETLYETFVNYSIDDFYKVENALNTIVEYARSKDFSQETEAVSWRVRYQLSDNSWSGWCLAPDYPAKSYSDRHVEIQALGVISQKMIEPTE